MSVNIALFLLLIFFSGASHGKCFANNTIPPLLCASLDIHKTIDQKKCLFNVTITSYDLMDAHMQDLSVIQKEYNNILVKLEDENCQKALKNTLRDKILLQKTCNDRKYLGDFPVFINILKKGSVVYKCN